MTRWIRTGAQLSQQQIDEVADTLEAGGIAVLPTDTIYGLHGVATDARAVARIFAAKRRPADQPLAVLCADASDLQRLGVTASETIVAALGRLWPAPLTAVLPIDKPIPASVGRRTIAVRIPDLSWMRDLVRATGALASTSVNLSGEHAVYSTGEVPAELLSSVDLVVDAGALRGDASTLVDFTTPEPRVIREGRFAFSQNLWKSVWKTL